MTRLSDLLRGAADRAPLGEASVSIRDTHRRIRVQRGVRGVANGLAGAGAAALIVVGVINPAITGSSKDSDGLAAPASDEGDRVTDFAGAPDSMYVGGRWGSCGSNLYEDIPDTTEGLTLAVASDGLADLEGSASVNIYATLTSTNALSARTIGPEAVLLYDGIVVARVSVGEAEQILDLETGGEAMTSFALPLVNCFDGAPLPAAKYELVVSQGFAEIADEPEPTPIATPEPTPATDPSPLPAVSADPDKPNSEPDQETIEIVPAPDIMPEMPLPWTSRELAPTVTLTIAGEPVEDPFGDYIWSPPDKPEDILTPELARAIYQAGLVSGAWDMAPGTSRWIIPNYNYGNPVAADSVSASRIAAPSGWYGCSWDGTAGLTFPTESAVLDLLEVSGTFPSRISLSYGWVVDDNPEVHFTVTNTSEYSLPGFYGTPNHSLYLVKDGRVVAEAWPQDLRPYSGDVVYAAEEGTVDEAAEYWGTLSPGSTLTGDYLWRDVSGCWTDSGPRTVSAGTYTLVTSQTIYIENSYYGGGPYPIMYEGIDEVQARADDFAAEADAASDLVEADSDAIVDPLIDPYYSYDWVELQVWTSLGTVTITTD